MATEKISDELNYRKQYNPTPSYTNGDFDRNHALLEQLDARARAAKSLVGRVVRQQYADGYAYYQVTGTSATRATVEVVGGIGDDWVLSNWGQKASASLKSVAGMVERNDKWNDYLASLKK